MPTELHTNQLLEVIQLSTIQAERKSESEQIARIHQETCIEMNNVIEIWFWLIITIWMLDCYIYTKDETKKSSIDYKMRYENEIERKRAKMKAKNN